MKCPTCGQICRTDREFCALCGTPLKKKKKRGGLVALLILLVLVLAGLAVYVFLLEDTPLIPSRGETEQVQETQPPVREEIAVQPEAPEAAGNALFENAARIYVCDSYTLALCRDGTLKVAGQSASPEFGLDLFDWANIRQVLPTDYFVAALTGDGRVRLTGEVGGYEEAARWTGVERLYYDGSALLGLTGEGKLLAAGPELPYDTASLKNIRELIVADSDTLAISAEGQVFLLRREGMLWDAKGASGIAAVAANEDYAYYLLTDGSVRTGASYNYYMDKYGWSDPVALWRNVRSLLLGKSFALGLTGDGEVLSAATVPENPFPDTRDWTGVVQLLLDRERGIAYGVTGEGRVLVAAASGETPAFSVPSWEGVRELQLSENYVAALTGDGKVLTWAWEGAPAPLEVSHWTGVSAIALGNRHLAALTGDGRVLAAGDNSFGQCG